MLLISCNLLDFMNCPSRAQINKTKSWSTEMLPTLQPLDLPSVRVGEEKFTLDFLAICLN